MCVLGPQIIQDLILESNRNSREQSRAEGDLQSVEKKNDEIRSALESAKAEVVRLQVRRSIVLCLLRKKECIAVLTVVWFY